MVSHSGTWRAGTAWGFALALGLIITGNQQALGAGTSSLGLSVNSAGLLIKNGAPYRGIGVNYYDAFVRTLRDPEDKSYRSGFSQLGAHHIPFARFAAGGWTANDFKLYLTDKEAYFQLLDGVVQSAEESNVGLIASLFWPVSAASAICNEPRERWGDPESKTRQFMRTYTREVVSRYSRSPAILGWEFGCELSLAVDLPNPPRHSRRFAARAMSFETFKSAVLDFAQVVRSIDSNRILLTGNSLPRAFAYHNATEGDMRADSEQQFATILLRDNPGPYSPICIHTSPASAIGYFADRKVSYEELLQSCVRIGRAAGKPVYVEEFVAVPGRPGGFGLMSEREYFARELAAIKVSGAPLASVWVYDRKLTPDRSNLTFDNEHSYMLQMIASANRN